jgi:S-adenosyl methyltransferase
VVSSIREDAPAGLDTTTPNVARMYDYLLGGKDNFAADRAAAEQLLAVIPDVAAIAADNRAFLGRAVRYLTSQGIRQFLDLGSGLPTRSNVHEVAQRDAPGTRVAYVDYDPVVALHGKALLASGGAGIDAEAVQAAEERRLPRRGCPALLYPCRDRLRVSAARLPGKPGVLERAAAAPARPSHPARA